MLAQVNSFGEWVTRRPWGIWRQVTREEMVKHRDFKDGIHLVQQDQHPFQSKSTENSRRASQHPRAQVQRVYAENDAPKRQSLCLTHQ
jgi:hypothetical protein